jgi:hypothetical protein
VPVPNWVKETLDAWLTSAGIESGLLFRRVCRAGKLWGHGISEKTVWHVVKKAAASMNIPRLAPHDFDGPALDSVMIQAASLSRFNSFLGMLQCKPRNSTSAASSV